MINRFLIKTAVSAITVMLYYLIAIILIEVAKFWTNQPELLNPTQMQFLFLRLAFFVWTVAWSITSIIFIVNQTFNNL